MVRYSVVTPTFDRLELIARSLDSSLAFARATGDAEVIVVDDASRDATVAVIRRRYADEIADGLLTLVVRTVNGGVTAARNDGIAVARGSWLVFVDSDDRLTAAAATAIPSFAARHPDAPVLFFRCEDEDGRLIGPPAAPGPLDLVTLLSRGTPGECLPVVSRPAMVAQPFDVELRGHELLAYLRLVRRHGAAMLSDVVARRYGTAGADRLSTRAERLRRAGRMAQGFAAILAEFGDLLPFGRRMALRARVVAYRLAAKLGVGNDT